MLQFQSFRRCLGCEVQMVQGIPQEPWGPEFPRGTSSGSSHFSIIPNKIDSLLLTFFISFVMMFLISFVMMF